ncbi:MAG: single-stranded-DNA-specific exonuclease RecJ [Candidatus Kerfeldbacteria bacterium]|nr:single-stranded-DNA-specific exonuclease RecJ [Candidatus Kerfeldbacteria bacterium]
MAKRWMVQPKAPADVSQKFPEIDPILRQLLFARGLTTQAAIDAFLKPDYSRDVHDPFRFHDMHRAVERIARALQTKERIVIYGDYDADGVCASAVLTETLTALGANLDVYIPFRETEGYGLNVAAVEELAEQQTSLIMTVDCGTSNAAEVARANELGLDVIITDHHDQPPTLPPAYAIVNPELTAETYPYRHLAAAGVAFKVATALLQHTRYGASLGRSPLPTGWEKWLLDLVAISTVTDMVPLLDENRIFVRFGLGVLRKTRRLGLRELFATMRTPLERADEETLAFQLGPRLNAAGRMNHASTAYRLLVTTDSGEAKQLATELSQANQERQRLTEVIVQEAQAALGKDPREQLLCARGVAWPVGLLGLVASKLVESHHRPAVVMTESHGRVVGSGRSVEPFDITAALAELRDHLDRFGGHPQACGFTLKSSADPTAFTHDLQAYAKQKLAGADLTKVLRVDADVVLDDINWELVADVERLAPFGVAAPRPTFVSRGVGVVWVNTVGKDGQHLRLHVTHATSEVHKTIGFRFGTWVEQLQPGDAVDLVFEVGVNEWNGNREIELKIVDLDHART